MITLESWRRTGPELQRCRSGCQFKLAISGTSKLQLANRLQQLVYMAHEDLFVKYICRNKTLVQVGLDKVVNEAPVQVVLCFDLLVGHSGSLAALEFSLGFLEPNSLHIDQVIVFPVDI